MAVAAGTAALALALVLTLAARPSPAGATPELTFSFPEDGAVLAQAPQALKLCFAEPIEISDLDKGGDFRFRLLRPNGRALGLRIIFQTDGYGADIEPGLPEDEPLEGEWTLEWRVTDPGAVDPAEGVLHFSVAPGGDPLPARPYPRCPSDGSPPPLAGFTPGAPTPTEPAQPTDQAENDDDDGFPLTAVAGGVAGAVIVLGAVGYLVSRRLGRWPPWPGGGSQEPPPPLT